MIILKEITFDNVDEVCELSDTLSAEHNEMVAPNAISLAHAYCTEEALPKAIYNDEELVGFIMLQVGQREKGPFAYLWRLMIATDHQGKGYGKGAIEVILEDLKKQGYNELTATHGEGKGSPKEFYHRIGFKPTGDMHSGETVVKLKI